MKAKVIAFSGIDGSGKSTQLKLVKDTLEEDHSVFVAKLGYFPLNSMGQNKFFDMLLKCRSGLEIIKYYTFLQLDEYHKYDYILCDRHLMCYLAYAYAYGVSDIKLIRKLLGFVSNPDLTLYFDIDVNESLRRITTRGKDKDKSENFETLARAKDGYERMFEIIPNIERVNANEDKEEINKNVRKILVKHKITA